MSEKVRTTIGTATRLRAGEQAQARTVLLLLVCFLAGLGVSAFWFYSRSRPNPPQENGNQTVPLSDTTRAVLQRLEGPIELRFYSLLDPASVPASLQVFAGRVDQLLSAYEQQANGKIKLTRLVSPSNSSANTATADGIKPFNMDKGDACFLGIAVVREKHKESLPELSPDWEQALESDLTRTIIRVINASAPPNPALAAASKPDPATIEAVKRALPNLASISVEDGTRVLQETALKEFKRAANEMQVQVKEAEQRLTQAQNGGSEADQQAAIKNLQQVQAEQTEKLKQIAAQSKAQIDALQRLKTSAP